MIISQKPTMKYVIYSVAAFVVFFGVLTGHGVPAFADTITATSSPTAGLGGYSTPCFYLRQTNEWNKDYTCNDAEYSMQDFALNYTYREAILADWRQHIFVDVAAKFGSTRSY